MAQQFRVLLDDGGRQESPNYARESAAWERFWSEVARQPDDGVAITGFDPRYVLASRTGLDTNGRRWYVHLMQKEQQ